MADSPRSLVRVVVPVYRELTPDEESSLRNNVRVLAAWPFTVLHPRGVTPPACCRELGLDYGHARIFSTYGPGDHPWSLLSSCVRVFRAGEKMTMTACTQLWNFMYIDDAGRALADLAEYAGNLTDHGCVYNLGGPMDETGPLRGFVETVYELCGRQGSMEFGVRPPNAEGIVNLIPDIRKMERVVGWKPQVYFEEGMKRILAFQK